MKNWRSDNLNQSAFEKTGPIPRSISRTFEKFKKELDPNAESEIIEEFRVSRYQTSASIKYLLLLIISPILVNQISRSFIFSPFIDYFWNEKNSEIFLNVSQEERAFSELQRFEEKIHFEILIGQLPHLSQEAVEKEIKNILNCRYKAIEESIKKVHFNDDRPEYRNIYITNLRDNIAYVYNGNKFEAVQKYSIINQLIDQHMNNIEVSLEDYKDRLPERTVEILDKLIEKLQDDHTSMIDEENNKEFKNYRLFKINEVKLMIYNETGNNTEVIKLKYNNSIFSKPLKEIEV